ncbi:arginine--tRNA ligase [Anaeromyxobacter sp. Fw109-5]|uniref:Arginine--tRNA ligase n=1 Tax=Anaeromyxobacter sp. (strain Fw109-5) TaxID=404589 RepID=SYR_ANADF|nr:arginine--tRNA ligase [Anaeromyxobacter sp. Fw109-5]A7HCP4.1 RecName: Full=Arginine--tRNA ligase; AltName: Full=Arginyl-tRNA synthetase; Short=ArgRS [Anaeromyxobacter sp. Fw109-5]ABS26490.1 arginyl-tRNA synthetase [Anaeromyxobacter sp. Fw109-5]
MVKDRVIELFRQALAKGAAEGRWPALEASFSVEAPRDPKHGDFAVNAAMVLAKAAGKPPRDLAQAIAAEVRAVDAQHEIAGLEVAGPGFINVRLAPDVWLRALGRVVAEGTAYGRTEVGRGKKVIVEYVSANPTGPMHVGHGRNAVVGDGVQSLLRWAGFEVTREYYVNDYGAQVQTLARSVHLRYQELFGRQVTMPPKSYPGEYVKDVAAALKAEHGDRWLDAPEAEWLALFRDRAVEHVLGLIREDLRAVNIEFDRWYSEKALYESGTVDRFLRFLAEKDLVYVGKLPPPKSKKGQPAPAQAASNSAHDLGEEGIAASDDLTLFRSSQYGDEVDRPVKKADGTTTYFCADIAYHWDKRQRADALVDVLGADHGGYVPRLEAALEALGASRKDLHVVLIQMVNLTRGGEAVKMSKRAGTVVSLREVVDEVGRDATRFIFLTRRSDAQLDFDIELAKRQTLDNPVFYVQYGHARLAQIFAKAREAGAPVPEFDLEAARTLTSAEEQDLIRRIVAFPDMLAAAALAYEPHRVAFYLQETIAAFHSYYTQGKRTGERVISADARKTAGRLFLCRALKQVLANGLGLLGVAAPERMESPETRDLADDV